MQKSAFLSGAQLTIKLRNVNGTDMVVAYATNLQMNDAMADTGVQVIGAEGNQAIEPLSYGAGGSFSVMSYADEFNSFIHLFKLYPRTLLFQTTFDIDVDPKPGQSPTGTVYTIYDCRLNDWTLSFAPGQLSGERMGFVARGIKRLRFKDGTADKTAETNKGTNATAFGPTI